MNPSPKLSVRMVSSQNLDNLSEFKVTAYREFGNPEPMAFCNLKAHGSFVLLHSVIVNSMHRRKGVGLQIVRWALDFAEKTWPEKRIYISAVPYGANPPTQEQLFGFYEQLGFVRTPGHPFEAIYQGKNKE